MLMNQLGINPNCSISLTRSDPLPNAILTYLRIQRSDDNELDSMRLFGFEGGVSVRNESEVLDALIESLESILNSFSWKVEELESMLENAVGASWACATVSIGEQSILRMALSKCKQLRLIMQCSYCRDGLCARHRIPSWADDTM